jgi:DNA polymerase-3 subunit epsilon
VRELRLIAEHKPPYNRRSRHPERAVWVKLTAECFPRLSIVRTARSDGADYVGPFPRRAEALEAIAAVHEVVPIRQCTTRLSRKGTATACILEQMGRCGAPCAGRQSIEEYARVAHDARAALVGDGGEVLRRLRARVDDLARAQRYEEAASVRDRSVALVGAAARAQRLQPVCASPQIVAARRHAEGGWEVVCVRFGRLAGVCRTAPGQDPLPEIEAMRRSAEVVAGPGTVGGAALARESELVLDWLEGPGVRLVDLDGQWTCPVGGAASRRDRPLGDLVTSDAGALTSRPAEPA